MLNKLYKSVLDQDTAEVVICDLNHTIVYMNPSADRAYVKWGGAAKLMGSCLFDCHNERSCEIIKKVVAWFAKDPCHNQVRTEFDEKGGKDVYMVALRDEDGTLIGYYEKHEYRNRDMCPLYDMD